ncbi:DUF998 domain-containing protein [Agromyces aurantiacus]|uniref:DUF998 domain-containing protein n=1 Tax=Agromyces aurantiacus TaxID=165814 RepID=A0ABV9R3P9_9MICO|nr:DUF998 domain-containing protein [Agromyces aurantiacus]MBM7502646.1 putative membrane protein [Agromyces aurantiacus]
MDTTSTHRIGARAGTAPEASTVDARARALVGAGIVAGPLFVVVAVVQTATREGFDLARHPISLLALGHGGWVQIANFIVAGALMLAFAVGTRLSLRTGPGRRWAPILFGVYGVGLVVGGAFTAQPALGFPSGAPEGYPAHLEFHSIVHGFAAPLSFLAVVAAMFVVGRRLAWEGHRAAAAWSSAAGVACALLVVPVGPGSSVRLFVGVAVAFAWISAYGVHLLRRPAPALRA